MKKKAKEYFESANYLSIIDLSSDLSRVDRKYLLAAYVFLGEELEAKVLYNATKWKKSEKVEVYFYMLLSSVRKKKLDFIQQDFLKLYQAYRNSNKSTVERFFLYQGFSLVRFYLGEFEKSWRLASKSYYYSLELADTYKSMIASDLMGHSLCVREDYSYGISCLDKAKVYAAKINNNKNSSAIDLAIIIYKIDSIDSVKNQEKKIDRWLSSLKTEDFYSLGNAYLLKTKLFILKGDIQKAEDYLEMASKEVDSHRSSRQILTYNFLYSIILKLKEDSLKALPIINTSLLLSEEIGDSYFSFKFLELKSFIQNNKDSIARKNELKLLSYLKKTGLQAKKIFPFSFCPELKIEKYTKKTNLSSVDYDQLAQLQGKGLLGLLLLGEVYPCQNFIDFNIGGRNILVCLSKKLQVIEKLSSNQVELLRILIKREIWTKKDLFEKFWKVQYDEYIHANKLYVTLRRLQKKLALSQDIFALEKGSIKVMKVENFNVKEAQSFTEPITVISDTYSHRISNFLNNYSKGEAIKPKDYSLRYKVSRHTSSRDLQLLLKSKEIKKLGKGAGTFYIRT